jgi:hypothetical protein
MRRDLLCEAWTDRGLVYIVLCVSDSVHINVYKFKNYDKDRLPTNDKPFPSLEGASHVAKTVTVRPVT